MTDPNRGQFNRKQSLMRGWPVELGTSGTMRKRMPGWKAHVIKKSLKLRDIVINGQLEAVIGLLREGADINYHDETIRGRSLLHLAVVPFNKPQNPALIELLLSSAADPNVRDAQGNTPLHLAAAATSVEIVRLLLAYGSEINAENEQGEFPLHQCARSGSIEVLLYLLDSGASNSEGNCKGLPLHYAIIHSNQSVIKELLRIESRIGFHHWISVSGRYAQLFPHNDFLRQCIKEIQGGKEVLQLPTSPADTSEQQTDVIEEKRRYFSRVASKYNSSKQVEVKRNKQGQFGFAIVGGMEEDSLPAVEIADHAEVLCLSGGPIASGDVLLAINGVDVIGDHHDEVVTRLSRCAQTAKLTVMAPFSGIAYSRPISAIMRDKDTPQHTREKLIAKMTSGAVSVTSRPPRDDEENGREYNFVSKAVFEYLIDQGLIQEWGTLNNHYYGTLNAPATITPASASGKPAPFLRSKTMLMALNSRKPQPILNTIVLGRNERGAWGLNISGGVETGDFVSIESVNVINLLSSTLGKPSPGDIILAVNGVNVAGQDHETVKGLIKASENEVELLLFAPPGQSRKLSEFIYPAPTDTALDSAIKADVRALVEATVEYSTAVPPEGYDANTSKRKHVSEVQFKQMVENGQFSVWKDTDGILSGLTRPIIEGESNPIYFISKARRASSNKQLLDRAVGSMIMMPLLEEQPTQTSSEFTRSDSLADALKQEHKQLVSEVEVSPVADDSLAQPPPAVLVTRASQLQININSALAAADSDNESVESATSIKLDNSKSGNSTLPSKRYSSPTGSRRSGSRSPGQRHRSRHGASLRGSGSRSPRRSPSLSQRAKTDKHKAGSSRNSVADAGTPERSPSGRKPTLQAEDQLTATTSFTLTTKDSDPSLPGESIFDALTTALNSGMQQRPLTCISHKSAQYQVHTLNLMLQHFSQKIEELSVNNDKGYQEEFESLARIGMDASRSVSALHPPHNRYTNIHAYDHSRVVLSTEGEQLDYINGNYVPGESGDHTYIATQAPVFNSMPQFWRMIWEKKCPAILMLTNEIEGGTRKCDRYWPEAEEDVLQYDLIIVSYIGTHVLDDFVVRKFTVEHEYEEGVVRELLQFALTSWPDHGVPKTPRALLNLQSLLASVLPQGYLESIDEPATDSDVLSLIDIKSNVTHIRYYRNFLVQTLQQYTFLYAALREALEHLLALAQENLTHVSAPSLSARDESEAMLIHLPAHTPQPELTSEVQDEARDDDRPALIRLAQGLPADSE